VVDGEKLGVDSIDEGLVKMAAFAYKCVVLCRYGIPDRFAVDI